MGGTDTEWREEQETDLQVYVTRPENLEAGYFPANVLWCPRRDMYLISKTI